MIPCSLDIRTLNSTGFFLFTSSLWRRISFHNGRFWNQSCAKRGTHHSMRFSHGITTAMVGQNPLPFAESMSEIIRFAESNAKKKKWWFQILLGGDLSKSKIPKRVFVDTVPIWSGQESPQFYGFELKTAGVFGGLKVADLLEPEMPRSLDVDHPSTGEKPQRNPQ